MYYDLDYTSYEEMMDDDFYPYMQKEDEEEEEKEMTELKDALSELQDAFDAESVEHRG